MARIPEGFATGDPGLFAAARRLLLDALDALSEHRRHLVLVGAQAVYMRVEEADLASTAFTTDADLGLDPRNVSSEPLIEQAMREAGFTLENANHPGTWQRTTHVGAREGVPINVDLLVPELLAGWGRRGASVPPHSRQAFRRVEGIETAIVDNSPMVITSLELDDKRSIRLKVAGVPSLLVAKAFKIRDRLEDPKERRRADKDAGDVIRLMQASAADQVGEDFARLVKDPLVGEVTRTGLDLLSRQFGAARTPGTVMAQTALAGNVSPQTVAALAPAFLDEVARHQR